MKKTRFTDEQIVTILREADQRPVPEVAKRHGVSAQTIYSWRKHFGTLEPANVKRLRQLEQENGRLKKMVADRDLEIDVLQEITRKNGGARVRRQQVASVRRRGLSSRRACAVLSVARSTLGYQARLQRRDAPALAIVRSLRGISAVRLPEDPDLSRRAGGTRCVPNGPVGCGARRACTCRVGARVGGWPRVAPGRSSRPREITCGPMTSSSTRARMAGR